MNDTRFLNETREYRYEAREYRFDGMTRSEAIKAGYEVEDDALWLNNPEAYKDECVRRILIDKGMRLWSEKSYQWRVVRHEFTFYEDLKRKLKIGITLPSHTQIKEWRTSLLLQCGCAGDALQLLRTMPMWQLHSEISFVENWLKCDCAFNTLTSWVYDMRARLKAGGVSDSYTGDILDNPELFKKPDGHSYHRTVSNISFRYRTHSEYSRAAAIY